MSNTIYTHLIPLPGRNKGYTVLMDDDYNIVINSNLCERARMEAYDLEMRNIDQDDLQKDDSADHIESMM